MIEVIEVIWGSAGPGYVARGAPVEGSRWGHLGFVRFRLGRWVWDLPMIWEVWENLKSAFFGSAYSFLFFFDFEGEVLKLE